MEEFLETVAANFTPRRKKFRSGLWLTFWMAWLRTLWRLMA